MDKINLKEYRCSLSPVDIENSSPGRLYSNPPVIVYINVILLYAYTCVY